MARESLLKFIATGMVVLPLILALGTGSLDAVAMVLAMLLIAFVLALVIHPDDPIGDKMRADAEKEKKTPPG